MYVNLMVCHDCFTLCIMALFCSAVVIDGDFWFTRMCSSISEDNTVYMVIDGQVLTSPESWHLVVTETTWAAEAACF
jgi:hypothetical protein